jgi:hypothetical protein
MAFDTPVLFLVFNRPDTTRKVFQRIREIQPSKLFIAADGARPEKDGEKEKCDVVKKLILDNIDWPCEVNTLFRQHNLGCGKAVSSAITWFFQNVEEGIVLEDDILPDKSFFYFCQELLEKYRYDDRIKVIGGSNVQKNASNIKDSYYFSAICRIWGWASWRRVWDQYDFSLQSIGDDEIEPILRNYFSRESFVEQWKKVFMDMKTKKIDTWDYQLVFSIWKNGGMNIVSAKNLVSNIGFGADATHTKDLHNSYNNQNVKSLDKLLHPGKIKINKTQDKYLIQHALGIQGALMTDLKERIRHFLKTKLNVDEEKQQRIKRLFILNPSTAK